MTRPFAERSAANTARVKRARIIGAAIGLLLLAAAGLTLTLRSDDLAGAWASISAASPALIALAAALPFVTVLITSAVFWVLTARYGRVGLGEMTALINTAWLLNYLPLWPGMFGRLAYHKAVNGIPVTDSTKAIIWANVLNIVAAGVLLAVLVAASLFARSDSALLAGICFAPVPVLGVISAVAARARPAADPHLWRLIAAVALRIAEIHLHAARYAVCFELTGAPIAWGGALAIAALAALAGAVNIAPNGLGVREWIVGLVAPLLPLALTQQTSLALTSGLAADLVNRAFEVMIAVPAGLIAWAWVSRRLRRASQSP